MAKNLRNRNFLKLLDFTPDEIRFLLEAGLPNSRPPSTAATSSSGSGQEHRPDLREDLHAHRGASRWPRTTRAPTSPTSSPAGSQIGHKESMKDTARVLGRVYDGIEYRGFAQETVETLASTPACRCGTG